MSLSTRMFWALVAVLVVASGLFALGAERRRAEQRAADAGAAAP